MDIEQQTELISRFLHSSTEQIDDWDWDGNELIIFSENQVEKYLKNDLKELIIEFI